MGQDCWIDNYLRIDALLLRGLVAASTLVSERAVIVAILIGFAVVTRVIPGIILGLVHGLILGT